MTPAARVAAAIDILDRYLAGEAAEKVLTNWARGNRYAGSSDRAAIRDHVFDAIRCRRSFGFLGGQETGRGLMIGACRASGVTPDEIFTGERYAPAPLSDDERTAPDLGTAPRAVRLDVQDWLLERFDACLGPDCDAILDRLRSRAPLFLRVNTARCTRQEAIERLAEDSVVAVPNALASTALEVVENPRRVAMSTCYKAGLVELQDAGSQAVVERLPVSGADRILDFCAGGGGKSLAMAAMGATNITAHDADATRMADLPVRAARAGVEIERADRDALKGQSFDLILCDVPCSGSGAWRRSPDSKWRLRAADLSQLMTLQREILDEAQEHARTGATLALVTCSLLREENEDLAAGFLERHPQWTLQQQDRISPLGGSDGFYFSLFKRD